MSWKDELFSKRTDAVFGSTVSTILGGVAKFEKVGNWPDSSDTLGEELLGQLNVLFSDLDQTFQTLIDTLKRRSKDMDDQALQVWLKPQLVAPFTPGELVPLVTGDLGRPVKVADLSSNLVGLRSAAGGATAATQELLNSKDFKGALGGTDTQNSAQVQADQVNVVKLKIVEVLDKLAPNEANNRWATTLSSIVRQLQRDDRAMVTLADLNAAIEDVELSRVGGDRLIPWYLGSSSARERDTRAKLKSMAMEIFGRKPTKLDPGSQGDGSLNEGAGVEEARTERTIGWHQKSIVIGVVVFALVLLMSVFIIEMRQPPGALFNFSVNEIARGFITLSFVVGAISIFLIVTTVVVFEDSSDPKDVYERAKTILSMILGILGTVIGFYFGTSDRSENVASDVAFALEVLPPELLPPSRESLASGYTLDVGAISLGGEGPIRFTVSLLNADGSISSVGPFTFVSNTGALSERVANLDLEPGTQVSVEFIALNADNVAAAETTAPIEVPQATE